VSVKRAARIGDAWLIVNTSGLGKVTALMQTYRAALKEYGRTPMDFPITVEATSAHATPRRVRNAGDRWNTSTPPMRQLSEPGIGTKQGGNR
jgi:alkanesulfonate monooxygenase SsuD/methylene tetrahydromethanopterin reductase-like flavin-dependent oxidoreductase (luciferase family)